MMGEPIVNSSLQIGQQRSIFLVINLAVIDEEEGTDDVDDDDELEVMEEEEEEEDFTSPSWLE